MVVVGAIASAIGIALGACDRLVPAAGLHAGGQDRHALGRPADRLGAGLRARRRSSSASPSASSACARARRARRPADPRQHAPRGHLDRDPGDPDRRPVIYAYVVLHDIEKAPAAGNERVVNVTGEQFAWTFEYQTRAASRSPTTAALPARGRVGQVRRPLQGRHPRLLGPGLPDEDRRRARDHDAATASRPRTRGDRHHPVVCAELCGLGPRLHAPDRPRRRRRPSSTRGCQKMTRRPARRPAAAAAGGAARRRRQGSSSPGDADTGATACGACHTLADAGATGDDRPDLDKVLKGKDAAFIQQSIVDPNAEIARASSPASCPRTTADALAAAARRAGRVPQVTNEVRSRR